MDLIEITRCKRDFDFKPIRKTNDSLPAVAWNGYLLTGFHRTSGTALNLKTPLHELLLDCYPKLTFPELARLIAKLEELPALYEEFKVKILATYQFTDHPEMDELMGLVLALPHEYQSWMSQKDLSAKELYPLRVVFRQKAEEAGDFVSKVLTFLKDKKSNRAQVARAIELSSDLFLMNREPFRSCATIEIWLRYLESVRFPKQKPSAIVPKDRVQKLPWPAHVQARWVMDGPSGGIEVTFNVHNPNELQATLDGLDNLPGHLKKDLWKNH